MLDTLRAVGALAVLTTHAAFWAGAYTSHGVWGTVLSRLDVGVAIFFVLSGFLLARPWLAAAAGHREAPGVGRYLWHRVLRIWPLYVVTVVVALGLIQDNAGLGPERWLTTLLMLDTFREPLLPAGLTQMWSLAVEVTFYLALPLVMLLAVGRRGRAGLRPVRVLALLVAMLVASLAWHLLAVPRLTDEVSGQPAQWLPGYLTWFAVGIGLAALHVAVESGTSGRLVDALVSLGRQPGACWAMAGGLLLLSATPLAGPSMLVVPTAGEAVVKHLLYAAIGGLLVLTCVHAQDGVFRRVFEARPLRHLGFVSYGVFCLHLPVLHLVMWLTGWELFEGRLALIWLLTTALTLVASELAYRLVERPSMRWRGARWPWASQPARTSAPSTGTSAR